MPETNLVIMRILEHLNNSMDDERVNMNPINHESLGMTYPRWCRIIGMMLDEGYITGFEEVNIAGQEYTAYKAMDPRVTMKGLRHMGLA